MLLLFYLLDVRGSSDLKDLSGIHSIHMTYNRMSTVPLLKFFEHTFLYQSHFFLSDSVVLCFPSSLFQF